VGHRLCGPRRGWRVDGLDLLTKPGYGLGDMALLLIRELGIGLLIGVLVGSVAAHVLRRARLATAGLYPVASLTVAALAYGGADTLHGSGFLAVYLAGLMIGSATIPAERTVVSFHQGLGWLAQVAMFLTLGLLVFPSHLSSVAVKGTVLALVLALLARPVAVAIATLPFAYNGRERPLMAWAGLRGAVSVVLATFPVIEHVPHSGGSAPKYSNTRSPATMRSPARASATWVCRATPWSVSSSGKSGPFLPAARLSCVPATSSTC
jgi:cell volume regulation protein A